VPTREELQAQADTINWFHSIDLAQGVRTKGASNPPLGLDQLPAFRGRSVLDIGAWDGYYAFLAEREGASRVVALDHYVWGLDGAARNAYWKECAERGQLPDHDLDSTKFWRPELPGKRGFDFARKALNSKAEEMVADFMSANLDDIGKFDVVLYLGVLYHMKEPLTCLERVRRVTRQVAVIETEALHFRDFEQDSLLRFHPGDELYGDFGNWYVPNIRALHSLCLAAGFTSVDTKVGPPITDVSVTSRSLRRRARRAHLTERLGDALSSQAYRAVVHAFA
jgi:tRNA (mo5U34)-methyltransferase